MLSYESTNSVRELVRDAALIYDSIDFLRYVENDKICTISFSEFRKETEAVASWTTEQTRKLGHPVRVAMVASNSVLYLKMLIGVMCGGGVSIPLNTQMNENTLYECINKSESDILIYEPHLNFTDDDIYSNCPNISTILYMANGSIPNCGEILDYYRKIKPNPTISKKDLAIILFTPNTDGSLQCIRLLHGNILNSVFNTTHDKYCIKLNTLPFHNAFCLNADILLSFSTASTLCIGTYTSKLSDNLTLFEPTLINTVPIVAQVLYTKIAILSKETNKTLLECKNIVFGKNINKIITGDSYISSALIDKYSELKIHISQEHNKIYEHITKEPIDYSIRTIYPLTNAQMFFINISEGNTTSNIPFLFKLNSSVDLYHLKRCIEALFEVHPILNNVIAMYEDKGYVNYRNDSKKVDIPIYSISKEYWKDYQKSLIQPFNYTENEPLYHIGIYIVEDEKYLFFDISHTICDESSISIMLEDLNTLYNEKPVYAEDYTFYEYILDERQCEIHDGLDVNIQYFSTIMNDINRTMLSQKDNVNLSKDINKNINNIRTNSKYEFMVGCLSTTLNFNSDKTSNTSSESLLKSTTLLV